MKSSFLQFFLRLLFGCASVLAGVQICAQDGGADAEQNTASESDAPGAGAATPEVPDPVELAKMAALLRAQYGKPAAEWPAPTLDPGIKHVELGSPGKAPAPESNPTTPEKATLGLSLFFDPRLSGSQQIACASCHTPDLGWADGRSFPAGNFRQQLKRHTPSLLGIGHSKTLFWDGSAATLEAQAVRVITNPLEMDANPKVVVDRLSEEKEFYGPRFAKAFGSEEINFTRVVQALAAFQRSLIIGRTPFDKFLAGKQESLSDEAVRGLHLFRTKARCLNCHQGPMLEDGEFHNVGLTYYGRKYQDMGRYEVTKKVEDVGKFKTPTLRNVARTGPWMHNGLFPSLDGVLRLYNAGMPRPRKKPAQQDDPLFPVTSQLLQPLKMTATELKDLKAFLEALNEPMIRLLDPPFPPLKKEIQATAATTSTVTGPAK